MQQRRGPGIKERKRREKHIIVRNDDKKSGSRAQQLKDVVQANEANPLLNASRSQKTAAAA